MKKNIDIDFENSRGMSILFLGRFNAFTKEEIELFLEKFDITYSDTLDSKTALMVESTMLSVLEEDIAYEAIKKKIPAYSADVFEKLYAAKLNSDSILMSLKLSNNQTRLAKLLHNTHLEDRLFLKLFDMYDWGEEGLFDNSENMEISTLFTKRFYKKERFDPATFHSPISIFEIAIISEDSEVLESLFSIPNLEVKQSRSTQKRPTNIRQALATNSFLNQDTLKKLLRVNDKNIDYFLAQNPLIEESSIQTIYSRADNEVKKALATNTKIDNKIFTQLLLEASEVLLSHQPIDMYRYNLIKKLHPAIGENENLTDEVIELLIKNGDEEIIKNLSANESVEFRHLEKIYALENPTFFPYLATNKNLPSSLIEALHEREDSEIDRYLALNSSLPKSILDKLYEKDDFEINKYLALNESMPIEYLQQLQLDTRLLNYLKENKTFTENILNNLGI